MVHPIARRRQRRQDRHRRRRRVQPDPVGQAPVLVGVIGQNKRHPARLGRGLAQARPVGGQIGDKLHPVAHRTIGGNRAFGCGIEIGLALKGNRPAQHPAIHFWQGHIHRDIARRKPAQTIGPARLVRSRKHHLKHRCAIGGGCRQRVGRPHGIRIRRSDRKAGTVQDHFWRRGIKQRLKCRHRDRILQRCHKNRHRVQAPPQQRLDHAIDRMQPRPLHQRPVKDQWHHRRTGLPIGPGSVQITNPRPRPIDPGPQQRLGRGRFFRLLQQRLSIAEEIDRVIRPPLDQIGPKPVPIGLGHGREPL